MALLNHRLHFPYQVCGSILLEESCEENFNDDQRIYHANSEKIP